MFNFLIPLIFCINFSLSVPKRDYALCCTFLAYSFLRYCEYNMRTSLLIFKGTLVFLIISTMLYSRDLDWSYINEILHPLNSNSLFSPSPRLL